MNGDGIIKVLYRTKVMAFAERVNAIITCLSRGRLFLCMLFSVFGKVILAIPPQNSCAKGPSSRAP